MEDKFTYFDDVDLLRTPPPKGMHRIVFIDEMRRLTDSRMSQGQKNRLVSNLFSDVFKLRNDLYYTDQDAWAVDKRVRLNVNYVIYPMFDEKSGWCTNYFFKGLREYEDFVQFAMGEPFYVYAFYAPPYYKFFDTEFHVEDFYMKFHPERFVDEFVKWLKRKHLEDRKLTLALVRYWNKTEAIGLDSSELSTFYTHLKLEGFG